MISAKDLSAELIKELNKATCHREFDPSFDDTCNGRPCVTTLGFYRYTRASIIVSQKPNSDKFTISVMIARTGKFFYCNESASKCVSKRVADFLEHATRC